MGATQPAPGVMLAVLDSTMFDAHERLVLPSIKIDWSVRAKAQIAYSTGDEAAAVQLIEEWFKGTPAGEGGDPPAKLGEGQKSMRDRP